MSARKTKVSVRLLCMAYDMDDVMEIEHGSYDRPWDRKDFSSHLRQSNCGGSVAHFEERVIGYAIYYLEHASGDLFIANMAVAPDARRLGVGTRLIGSLLNRAVKAGLTCLSLGMDRKNVGAMRFFRFHQFKVTRLMREFQPGVDAWEMRYRFNR